MTQAMTTQAVFHDARIAKMTLDEWADLPDDEPGEFVDGYLVEPEVPNNTHEVVIAWLIMHLGVWGASRGVLVLASGAKFVISPTRGRMPDLSVFFPDRPRPPRLGVNRTPPAIAVEVVSQTPRDARRDRVAKLSEYAAFGIESYWIVDPWVRTFEVLELDPGKRYAHVVDATDERVDAIPACPGLVLDLAALWKELDALAEG